MRRSSRQTSKPPPRGDDVVDDDADSRRFFRVGRGPKTQHQEQLPRSAVMLALKRAKKKDPEDKRTMFVMVVFLVVLLMACMNLYGIVTLATTTPSSPPTRARGRARKNSHGIRQDKRKCRYGLTAGSKLVIGQVICSVNGRYQFGLAAENGDLVMWNHNDHDHDNDDNNDHDDTHSQQHSKTILWSIPMYSRHSPRTPQNTTLTMFGGGNVVVKDKASSKQALLETGTGGSPGAILHVTNHGSVRILAKNQQVLWDSHVHYFCHHAPRTTTTTRKTPILRKSRNINHHDSIAPVNADTLHHKVMAGYQGWFRTDCDGDGSKWKHWTKFNVPPNVNTSGAEMWPDLSEWNNNNDTNNGSEASLCPTGFHFKNGANAPLFGSLAEGVIQKHVQWMHDYGIDGVFVQRFVTQLTSHRCQEDEKLDQIRRHSEQYGRVFVNMYDISGCHPDSVYAMIQNDWMHLVDDVKILESDRYLRHNGKPILTIWGFGFKNRVNDPEKVAELIDWFQNKAPAKYQVTLMGGVPAFWRTLGRDSLKDEAWASIYRSYDILSPWTVGRYANNNGADKHFRNEIGPDILECEMHGMEYFPVIFPGYSFSHRNASRRFNQIPRMGGKFLWRQMYNAIHAGSKQVYVAMFDEVDEGTAIFKTAATSAQTPDQGKWLTLDADGCHLPSDWYLQLVGNATTLLRESGHIPETIPALNELQCNDDDDEVIH